VIASEDTRTTIQLLNALGVENRPRLGSGPPPTPTDLRRAARLSRVVAAAATVLACAVAVCRERLTG